MIPAPVFEFLSALKKNNNKAWFDENKPRYVEAQSILKAFASEVKDRLELHDEIEGVKVFRIYRDVRFSKDKTPYKNNLGMSFVRATPARRGGYYLHIEPNNCFLAGGFWNPESKDLKRIRQELDLDAQPLREIIANKTFIKHFGSLQGEEVKSAPRGYKKDHPNIDLLKKKQFLLIENFSDKEVMNADFLDRVAAGFKAMRPFHDFMSEVLTTNMNGESIL